MGVERRSEQGTRNKEQGTDNDRRGQRKGDDLADRLLEVVEGVRRLLPALQVDPASRHVATKELREAHYWLRVAQRSDWLNDGAADGLVDEVDQLIAILVASARTAKSHAR